MSEVLQASVTVHVPFHDVDAASIVWHGHYLKYFELARCALLDKIDYGYKQMVASGYIWPIVDISARFVAPLRYEDTVSVVARLREWEYRLVIDYLVAAVDGTQVARGSSTQLPLREPNREMVFGSPTILLAGVARAREKAGLA